MSAIAESRLAEALRGTAPGPCNWGDQCSTDCAERVHYADEIWPLFDIARAELKVLQAIDVPLDSQLDMFAEGTVQAIEMWNSIHAACGREYRRRAKLFGNQCPQNVEPLGVARG